MFEDEMLCFKWTNSHQTFTGHHLQCLYEVEQLPFQICEFCDVGDHLSSLSRTFCRKTPLSMSCVFRAWSTRRTRCEAV